MKEELISRINGINNITELVVFATVHIHKPFRMILFAEIPYVQVLTGQSSLISSLSFLTVNCMNNVPVLL